MVIEDGRWPEPKGSSQKNLTPFGPPEIMMAWPTDRLGAVIVDAAIVLTPLVTLLSAPLERLVLESMILGSQDAVLAGRMGQLTLALMVLFFYQTVFWRSFGATLGQLFFGLRVVNYHSRRPLTLSQSALRSSVWVGQWLFLFGIPFLTTFSHQFRRTWHDRLADSQVISLRARVAPSPGTHESFVANGLFAGAIYLGALFFSYHFLAAFHSLKHGRQLDAHLTSGHESCPSVQEALKDWPQGAEELEVAMALYAAGAVEEDCLEPELGPSWFDRTFSGLDYLALAFVHGDNSKRSDAYLKAVCEQGEESYPCAMSHWIRSSSSPSSKDSGTEVLRSPSSLAPQGQESVSAPPLYFELWRLRHSMKAEDYPTALSLIQEVGEVPSLMPFLRSQEIRARWGVGQRARARDLAEIVLPFLNPEESLELASWMCFEEMSFSCYRQSSISCSWARRLLMQAEAPVLAGESMSLLWLRENSCQRAKQNEPPSEWIKQAQVKKKLSQEIDPILSALELTRDGQSEAAEEKFLKLAQDESLSTVWRGEAWGQWVYLVDSFQNLEPALDYWRSMAPSRARVRLGQVLMDRALELGHWKLAMEMGEFLKSKLSEEELYRGRMVVAAWNLGHRDVARGWLETLGDTGRGPAAAVRPPLVFDNPWLSDQYSRIQSRLLLEIQGKSP